MQEPCDLEQDRELARVESALKRCIAPEVGPRD
jgi:hypothetical protein